MAAGEKFSVDKFFDLSPAAWYKVFGLGFKVIVIILLVFGVLWVKNLIFPPAAHNVNEPHITVSDGGKVSYTVHQSKKDRAWYIPSPFVEVFSGIRTDSKKPDMGIRFGARWDF